MRIRYQLLSSETAMAAFLAAVGDHCADTAGPSVAFDVRGTDHGAFGSEFAVFAHYDLRAVVDLGLTIRTTGGYDAVVMANSLDTGIVELREILDIPVVSLLETACFWACTLGMRFALVVPHPKMAPRYRRCVEGYGLAARLAGIEAIAEDDLSDLDAAFADRARGDAQTAACLAACRRGIEAGADVVIPAGPHAMLLAQRGLFALGPVPLLDGYGLAAKIAETAVGIHRRTGVCVSRSGLYRGPSDATVARILAARDLSV
ncbi:aspartate/glutamate racemase family protein [Aquabacter spiritensis]|uniref:Asp/Glu/hydantoin racemase n=1 Tax=Aquabacter spiritensis TaxID=933073 RepID=A0A4R3M1M1_9HYPH|nr:aspartate/glutamate racemase family protein [Aquabacter spiritensis]TCT05005.1 Asp/Glu/hydantoin racemase [Aquabacter spiritensis]